ncbi:MAG: 50S ribosomal protein L33 [Phycisphaerales bacterium]
MAKKKGAAREYVWLQCTDCGDLNYRSEANTKGGMPEGLKAGLSKYCPRTRKHVLHKVKRK